MLKSRLRWRRVRDADLLECLLIHPDKIGAQSIGIERALQAWRKIFSDHLTCRAALVESTSESGDQTVAFGIAAFVTQGFADAELANPEPGLNMRVINSIDAGKSVIASPNEVAKANTRGELQQVIFYTNWRRDLLDETTAAEARYRLTQAYAHLFAGFRVARVLSELADSIDIEDIRRHPGAKIVSHFEEFHRRSPASTWNRDRALAVATVESMRDDSGSLANAVFLHRQPVFGFTEGEQMLLEEALEGFDDEEAARHLSRTVAAVKRRWATIFNRVADKRPGLCPVSLSSLRGVQKRHRILNYLREHPEELRPFRQPYDLSSQRFPINPSDRRNTESDRVPRSLPGYRKTQQMTQRD